MTAQATELSLLLDKTRFDETGRFANIDDAIKLLAYMVRYNTSSSHIPDRCKSNQPFIRTLEEELRRLGIETLYMDQEYPKGSGKLQSTLVARIGPKDTEGGTVLSSHTDVIPIEGQKWDSEPFDLTDKAGNLTGRGAVDMKHSLATYFDIACKYHDKQERLKKPVYLALSWGEEIGCMGVQDVVSLLKKMNASPDAIIVGEPTEDKLLVGHKGAANEIITISTHGGHSMDPEAWIDAGDYAVELRDKIKEMQQHFKNDPKLQDNRFQPSYPIINLGYMEVGKTGNTVPGEATLGLHLRPTPKLSHEEMVRQLKELIVPVRKKLIEDEIKKFGDKKKNVGITLKGISVSHMLVPPTDTKLIGTMQEVMKGMGLTDVEPKTAGYAADAGGLSQAFKNATTVLFGTGALGQFAHQPNEFVTRDQLLRAPVFPLRMIAELCLDPKYKDNPTPDPWMSPTGDVIKLGQQAERGAA